ncbi:hypothetical protein CHELA20_50382 [Hyphomicrobiales bacterium]|jgi:CspA family cold shock protein|nr:hypothetical protein CHELA20_50382 [Hyphomicrobiales bacterium]CAH1679887.1 hypothetical protein CHELA41_24744 [Hyphomicrobiales bacterium]
MDRVNPVGPMGKRLSGDKTRSDIHIATIEDLALSHARAICRVEAGATRRSLQKDDKMATGTVKWFNDQKGYGFIQPDNGGKDVFVHVSAVERSGLRGLTEGQKIAYEVEADRRTGKDAAVNLQQV